MNIEDKTKEIIATYLNINQDDVLNTSDLRFDLCADSLDIEAIYQMIECEFIISCDGCTSERIRTVQDVIDYVVKEINLKQGCCV